MHDICFQEIDLILSTTKEIYYGITDLQKVSPLYVYEDKRCYKRCYKLEEHLFGIQLSHVDLKIATMFYSYIPIKINIIFSHHILHLCHH